MSTFDLDDLRYLAEYIHQEGGTEHSREYQIALAAIAEIEWLRANTLTGMEYDIITTEGGSRVQS